MAIPIDRSRLERFSRGLTRASELYFKSQLTIAQQEKERAEKAESARTINQFAESLFRTQEGPTGEETEAPVTNQEFLRNYTQARGRLANLGPSGARAAQGLDLAANQWSQTRRAEISAARPDPSLNVYELALKAEQGDEAAKRALEAVGGQRIAEKQAGVKPTVKKIVTAEGVYQTTTDQFGAVSTQRIGDIPPDATVRSVDTAEGVIELVYDKAGTLLGQRTVGSLPPSKAGVGKQKFDIPITYQENGKIKTETIKSTTPEDAQRQVLTEKLQIERQLQNLTTRSVGVDADEVGEFGWEPETLNAMGVEYDADTDRYFFSINLDMIADPDPAKQVLGEKIFDTVLSLSEREAADTAELKKQIDAAFQSSSGARNALNKWKALRRAQATPALPGTAPEGEAPAETAPAPEAAAPAEEQAGQYTWQFDPASADGALKRKIDALNDPKTPPDIKNKLIEQLVEKGYLIKGK